MLRVLLLIGLGGFLGSVLRFAVSRMFIAVHFTSFPIATFLVNIVGSFIIGLLFAWNYKNGGLSDEWRLFLATGFCGGFTTFSSFAFENLELLQNGNIQMFFFYALLSIALSLGAVYLGFVIIK